GCLRRLRRPRPPLEARPAEIPHRAGARRSARPRHRLPGALQHTAQLLQHRPRPDALYRRAVELAEARSVPARQAHPDRRRGPTFRRAAGICRHAVLALRRANHPQPAGERAALEDRPTAAALPHRRRLTVLSLGRNLRIGIAGTGFGAAVHLPALQSLPGVTVVAIAGARQEKAAEIAGRYGIARSCQGIAALLAEDLDAVTLALPPDLAETAASLALDKGLAVLAEKPLASHAEAAEALARRATARTAVVDFEFAELDCFRALHGLIERGELGAIARVEIAWA